MPNEPEPAALPPPPAANPDYGNIAPFSTGTALDRLVVVPSPMRPYELSPNACTIASAVTPATAMVLFRAVAPVATRTA